MLGPERNFSSPLRLGAEFISGSDVAQDYRVTVRHRDIMLLHFRWAITCRRVLEGIELGKVDKSWQEFASQPELLENDSRLSLSHNASRLRIMESLNSGICIDVASVHHARHLWYFEDIEYRTDCTLLLVKLLGNMRWARAQGKPHLMFEKLGFPLFNYKMGTGPTFPAGREVFGKKDAQIVVHDGKDLIYFEEKDALTRGRYVNTGSEFYY